MNLTSILPKDKHLVAVLGVFVVFAVGFAVVGGFRSYSPVPFWDMWDGYIGFFEKASEGDWSAWWAQHNEHRIFLARLLFWADLRWFGGTSWFLISTNFCLVGASAFVFWRIIDDQPALENFQFERPVLGLFITAWLFLWIQRDNLTSGFQGLFILAQLLPLCALYWLHQSVAENSRRHFYAACGFGVAAVGAMANGVLVLPLMVGYALLTRQEAARVVVLVALSAVTFYFYFRGYHAPDRHGSLAQAFSENPFGVVRYVLLYLGSPFYYLSGQGESGKVIASISGLVLIGSSALFAIKSLRLPRESTLQLAMLFFILYVGGTAVGTAGGRLVFGVDQALSGRYTTPTLMAWSALLVLYAPALLAARGLARKILWIPFALVAILMIPIQLDALVPQDDELFGRWHAALALELQIKDELQLGKLYPSAEVVLSLAEKPSADNLSIFGMYPLRDARERLGTTVQQLALPTCQGSLDEAERIDGDIRFVRLRGWMFNPSDKGIPQFIRVFDDQGKVVGYAITGQSRPDVAKAIDKNAMQSGYGGYLFSDQKGKDLTLRGESPAGPSCQMRATAASSIHMEDVLDIFDEKLSTSEPRMAEKCTGNIDEINNIDPAPLAFSASKTLGIRGWLADSVEQGTLPEAVYVVLTDAKGNHKYLRTHLTNRQDVGAYFKQPKFNESGFSTTADVSQLEGRYSVGLAMKSAGEVKICPQFKILATFAK